METKKTHYFLISLIIIFLGLVILLFSGFMASIVLAIIISILSYKLYEWLVKKLRGQKTLASLLIILLIIIIIILPTVFILTLGFREALDIYQNAHVYFTPQKIDKFLKSDYPASYILKNLSAGLDISIKDLASKEILPIFKNIGSYLFDQLDNIISLIIKFGIGFFVMLVTIFYLLKDSQSLEQFFARTAPLEKKYQDHLFQIFGKVSRAIFYGNFISALIVGFCGGIGFWIFKLSSPILWGTAISFVSLIPIIGPYLLYIPITLYLLLIGEVGSALGFIAYNAAVTAIIDHIIKPLLIGGKIQIHPLLILVSILGGIKIFGILGIIYGPIIIAVFLTLIDIYVHTQSDSNLKNIGAQHFIN